MNTTNTPILFVNADEVLHKFDEKLKEFEKRLTGNFTPKEPQKYITRAELCQMFDIDLSTENRWRKAGKINAYGIGNRVYYLRSEIDELLKKSKI